MKRIICLICAALYLTVCVGLAGAEGGFVFTGYDDEDEAEAFDEDQEEDEEFFEDEDEDEFFEEDEDAFEEEESDASPVTDLSAYLNSTAAEEENSWVEYDYQEITVANPTPMQGKFFTTLWGGSTSDLDVQELLHGYNLVKWDGEIGRTRFDHSVVSGEVTTEDGEGNRTYTIFLQEGLCYSNEAPITVRDYVFTLLFMMDPAIAETGGTPVDQSWIKGAEEYLQGETSAVAGVRILNDYQFAITVRAEALPYFYELSRLSLKPYPIDEIAPGHQVRDDGQGAYISPALTAAELKDSVLDKSSGYLQHPRVVSGPYTLMKYDGRTASFERNEQYKGNEEGRVPYLAEMKYTQAGSDSMIQRLGDGRYALLNKVTLAKTLQEGIALAQREDHQFTMTDYPRTGLTLIWFNEHSVKAQEMAVRKAVAYCLDREAFVNRYVGPFGMVADGYYGLGQWMYQMVSGASPYQPPLSRDLSEEERAAWVAQSERIESLNLEGLTKYSLNVEMANELLDEAGWTLNMGGGQYRRGAGDVRYKLVGNQLLRLRLNMAVPDSEELVQAMDEIFLPMLAEAGIEVVLHSTDMEQVELTYNDGEEGMDMAFLGENFMDAFDPSVFYPDGEGEIAQTQAELYQLSQEMLRTEPEDVAGYLEKWVNLQEVISQTLPMIPIYTNVYFDFYTRELYDYHIEREASWADAILSAYLSEPEYYDSRKNTQIEGQLSEMEALFGE